MEVTDMILASCQEELQEVVNRMLAGLENWEQYVALQARAATILEMRAHVVEAGKRAEEQFQGAE